MKLWLSLGLSLLLLNPAFGAEKAKAKPAAPAKQKNMVSLDPSLSFKPDNMLVQVEAGTTLNEKILVRNNEDIEFQAQVIIVPVFSNESGAILRKEQTVEIKGKNKGKPLSGITPLPFIDGQVQEKIVTIKPKQVTVIPVAFKVPADAKGSYYFQYSVQPLNEDLIKIRRSKMKKNGTTGANMAIAVMVYSIGAITVKNKSNINITALNQVKYIPQAKQLMIQSRLTNKGNDYVRKYSGLAVVSKGGKVVAKFDLNNSQNNFMLVPGSTQMFVGAVEANLTKGDYEILITYKDLKGAKLSTFKESLKVN